MAEISSDIVVAQNWLNKENVIAIPTETVYGLAARTDQEKSIQSIFQIKNRPLTNPLIVHIADVSQVLFYANHLDSLSEKLMEAFWPGPLTFLLPVRDDINKIITAGQPKIALRMPSHPLTLALLKSLPVGLVAPSANPSNYISPTTAQHVNQTIGSKINFILDGGPCEAGIESTIIETVGEEIYIYRKGTVTDEMLSKFGKVIYKINETSDRMKTPGSSSKHYSPGTSLLLSKDIFKDHLKFADKKTVIIAFNRNFQSESKVFYMSDSGNVSEAARNIYKLLYEADHLNADLIIVEELPEKGIGIAVNDRLRRAATYSPK